MNSKVYFIKTSLSEGEEAVSAKALKLFKAGSFAKCFRQKDFTAVKIHVGEAPNNTYIKAGCIKSLADELLRLKTKPFLTDTSTLYLGRRHNAIDHTILAAEHGFSLENLGLPFICPDGLFGTAETVVEIDAELNKEVFVAYDIARCQSILSISHFTGHMATCAAATLKTLGMGCTSRKGKMRQHAALRPQINDNCTGCGECAKHCPVDVITFDNGKAHISQAGCIGCAECLAVCRFAAVQYDWGVENKLLQKNIAEHSKAVLVGKKDRAVFFNYILSVAENCDCFGAENIKTIVDDIGIVASTDPVAVDKAAIDLIENRAGQTLAKLLNNSDLDPSYQIKHAENIGLGTSKYQLIEVD